MPNHEEKTRQERLLDAFNADFGRKPTPIPTTRQERIAAAFDADKRDADVAETVVPPVSVVEEGEDTRRNRLLEAYHADFEPQDDVVPTTLGVGPEVPKVADFASTVLGRPDSSLVKAVSKEAKSAFGFLMDKIISPPTRISSGISTEIAGVLGRGAEKVGLPSRVGDPLGIGENTVIERLLESGKLRTRGQGGSGDLSFQDILEADEAVRADRNFLQNLTLDVLGDPLNVVPGLGVVGKAKQAPKIARGGATTAFPPSTALDEAAVLAEEGIKDIGTEGTSREVARAILANQRAAAAHADELATAEKAFPQPVDKIDDFVESVGRDELKMVREAEEILGRQLTPSEALEVIGPRSRALESDDFFRNLSDRIQAQDAELGIGAELRTAARAIPKVTDNLAGRVDDVSFDQAVQAFPEQIAIPQARTEFLTETPKFTRDMGSPKPRYGKDVLEFESDLDKAFYIIGGPKGASRTKMLAFIARHTNLNVEQARIVAKNIRNVIRETPEVAGVRSIANQADEFYSILKTADSEVGAAAGTRRPVGTGTNVVTLGDELLEEAAKLGESGVTPPSTIFKKLANKIPKSSGLFGEILNMPRALLTMLDQSAWLRQGGLLAISHPGSGKKMVNESMRAFLSESQRLEIDELMRSNKWFKHAEDAGLFIGELGTDLASREEILYGTRLLGKLTVKGVGPGQAIKASERGYTTALNTLRMDVFARTMDNWADTTQLTDLTKTGLEGIDPEDIKLITSLVDYLNAASGRGSLKFTTGRIFGDRTIIDLERAAPFLSAIFFAPRFAISHAHLLGQAFNPFAQTSWTVRKMIAKDLTVFFAAGSTLLFLLSQVPGVSVELNPKSSDFGKGRVGNTSFDIWGGYTKLATLLVRMQQAETKSSRDQITRSKEAQDSIMDYIKFKLSPPSSAMIDIGGKLAQGKRPVDFLGRDIEGGISGIGEAALKAFAPIILQDIWDAYQVDGLRMAGMSGVSSFVGLGTQSFERGGGSMSAEEIDKRIRERNLNR